MKDYRLYCFDGASRITAAEWISAATDHEAVDTAKVMMNGCFRAEVWDRDRLVEQITPDVQETAA